MKTELKFEGSGNFKHDEKGNTYSVHGGGASLEVKNIKEHVEHYHTGGVSLGGLYHLKLPLILAIVLTFVYRMFALILTAVGAL